MKTKIFCILDGFGVQVGSLNNAAFLAAMPNFRSVLQTYPWILLDADGEAVGQETGLVGNSEVGHMNLGGLQLVKQLSYQITQSSYKSFAFNLAVVKDQQFDGVQHLSSHLQYASATKTIHLVGLFSTGTIHSDLRHWVGAIEAAGKAGYSSIVLHIMSDGRDSDRQSLVATWQYFTTHFADRLKSYASLISLGSVGGRFYGMDRDNNMSRTEKGLQAMVQGTLKTSSTTYDQIEKHLLDLTSINYEQGTYDEMLTPVSCGGRVKKGDTVWVLNFRADRCKQLMRAMCEYNEENNLNLHLLSLASYDIGKETLSDENRSGYYPLFIAKPVQHTLAEYVSLSEKTQLHIAETEKYAHVTYFFNGGIATPHDGEVWEVIDSNKVKSHSEKPEMKAKEITDFILDKGIGKFDYIVVNYANPDMVGHTGDIEAATRSMNKLDEQLGRLLQVVEAGKADMVLTADHGNIEAVGSIVENNTIRTDTEHNANPVPCVLISQTIQPNDLLKHISDLQITSESERAANGLITHFATNNGNKTLSHQWFSNDTLKLQKLPLWYAGLLYILL
jgi:2,3-bisphosphoglycerate-independent phosphoglycerate mutase